MRSSSPRCPTSAVVLAATLLPVLAGCSAVVSSTTRGFTGGLTAAVLDQNDPETVRQGAPAYLLLVDGLIAGDPDDPELLIAGAQLYASYTTGFVDDHERAKRLAERARDYGWRALCASDDDTCGVWELPFADFERAVGAVGPKHVPALFAAGAGWATWVQVNRDDWVAVADKARVEAIMKRVAALDEDYREGAAYVFLGVLNSIIPKALGGNPEQGRRDFERAVELSRGRDLTAKVLLASEYARLVFDRELHDRLLEEVLAADPEAPGLTLSNTMAQAQARRLLADADDYFGE